MTGNSGGWKQATFGLSAYAGKKVEVSISYVTDPSTGGVGAFVDDTRLVIGGKVRESEGFEKGLGPWSISGQPAGSPPAGGNFRRAEGLLFGAVSTKDSVLLGFGVEQVASPTERARLLKRALGGLLKSKT